MTTPEMKLLVSSLTRGELYQTQSQKILMR
ncbi:uncharacterized protein METZ01_LOCUS326116 [marine metagenome]|uniref:Uncharacterized protein n=1 Tax=marine metagenome TaxID=408172 RepID=A0A382PMP5_9ZZZZ